jgi:hypothetical protein
MEGQFTYQDFDLLIEPGAPGYYRARVLRSPAGESAQVEFTLPFSPVELENFVLKLGRPPRSTRGPGRPESAPLKDFGGKLYGAVFQGELRDTLMRSLTMTSGPRTGLRLRLRLGDAPELAELPWEFLYDGRLNRFLAQSRRTPVMRYLDLPDPPHPLAVDGPLRLLVMISSPTGYPPLDVEQEWSLLTDALAAAKEEGQVIVERLPASMSTLRRQLRRQAFHMFHFVGHGYYRPDWADGVLIMEDPNGRPQEVTGEELGSLLNEYDQTRLAVLNACEGARTDASGPFAGVAQSLIQQGLPAVVAMQFEITDDAAIIFAQELYGAIADGYPLEAALAEARGAIRDAGNPAEWGTPVWYSRAPDGHLFHLTTPGRSSNAAHRAPNEGVRLIEENPHTRPIREESVSVAEAAGALPASARPQAAGPSSTQKADLPTIAAAGPPALTMAARQPNLATTPPYSSAAGNIAKHPQSPPPATSPQTHTTAQNKTPTRRPQLPRRSARILVAGATVSALLAGGFFLLGNGSKATPPTAPEATLTDPGRDSVNAVAFSPNGKTLAAGDSDGSTILWNIATSKITAPLNDPGRHSVDAVAFSPNGETLAASDYDGSTHLWNIATKEITATLTDPRSHEADEVAFSPNGETVAVAECTSSCHGGNGPANGHTTIFNLATGKITATLIDPGKWDQVIAMALSPDGKTLAVNDLNRAYLWSIATRRIIAPLDDPSADPGGADALEFSPNGKTLAAGFDNGSTYLWNTATRKITATLHDPHDHPNADGGVASVAFSPNGKTLAAGDGDGDTYLWNIATRKITATLTGPHPKDGYAIDSVAFSLDGKTLAVGEGNGSTYLWNMNWLSP